MDRRPQIVMPDGNKVTTEVAPNKDDLHLFLYLSVQFMRGNDRYDPYKPGDMIVSFDTEWTPQKNSNRIVLLKMCTLCGCILIRLDNNKGSSPVSESLKQFFLIKDLIFVGVHIKEEVKRLREDFGIEVRNAVELSELAASVLGKPRVVGYGVRDLAGEVLSFKINPKSFDVLWSSKSFNQLTLDEIESGTIDVYAAYMIGRKLLA